jgi:GNAT superfamily N-acetyltransferase
VFVHDDAGRVIGGAQGELEWGWLYVDLLWLEPSLRGQGIGREVMTGIEQAAYDQDCPFCWLATTSFQALPFYRAIGYEVVGTLEDRPPDHRYYFLQKAIMPDVAVLSATLSPEQTDIDRLRKGLAEHTRSQSIAVDSKRLAVFLEDAQGAMYGGLVASTYWGWLDIQAVWLPEAVRGQGYGAKLLAMAEAESIRRGCPNSFVDVAGFQGLCFFEKYGYVTFGTLADRPPGYMTHFMKKALR